MNKLVYVIIVLFFTLLVISCQEEYPIPESCDVYDFSIESGIEVGNINGYTIYRGDNACDWVVGEIIVEGYDFGYFYWGCSRDLSAIGYYAEKDDIHYFLQDLVDNGEISVAQIYYLYMCDPYKAGIIE